MSEKKIDYKEIGRRIRQAREAKNMSQGELGSRLSSPVTATAISLYEKGNRDIGLDSLSEVAKIFEVSMESLIDGYKEAPPIPVALRADKELKNNPKAQKQIIDFIDMVKLKENSKK